MILNKKFSKYLLYAAGEIILVVIGILIALQVNNWNEERKRNERFKYGLSELHNEILSNVYSITGLKDKLQFQTTCIDSILNKPVDIKISRIPGMLMVLDQTGIEINQFNQWKSEFIEINPNTPKRNELAKALRQFIFSTNKVEGELEELGLMNVMLRHLQRYNIPVMKFEAGSRYKTFIENYSKLLYSPDLNDNISELLRDENFQADLKSLSVYKSNMLGYTTDMGNVGESFQQYLQRFEPNMDFSIKYMEVIGTATEIANFAQGMPMQKMDKEGLHWETTLDLLDGEFKFRGDAEWLLDFGASERSTDELVYKGGNIPVTNGRYQISLDLENVSYKMKKIDD